ncbi:MAG TPA: EAL domain-containing protein [Rhodospirillaceae bacterium]|nr:EAL domain-containing protein [Rhodospirillaceae bacterium]
MSHLVIDAFYQALEAMIVTDRVGRILHANHAFTGLTGYQEDEIVGQTPRVLRSDRHDSLFYQAMWKELLLVGEWSGEVWNKRKDGEIYPQRLSIAALRHPSGDVHNYVAVMSDLTASKSAEQRIEHQATHDPLTGLPNRVLFLDRLANACSRATREHEEAALLMLDLDRFKLVNDSLGHEAGDQLLRETAGRLLGCVRETDTVARIGGDEFTIIIPNLRETKDVEIVAKKILKELTEPFQVGGSEPAFVSASIGIAVTPTDATTPDSMMRYADMAMYQAKDEGRNNYRFFSDKMNDALLQRIGIVRDIHRALANNEFEVYYQPILDSNTGCLVGAEALLRWNRPDGKQAPAVEFIAVAEDTGLIIPIGEAVLDKVVNSLVAWRRAGAAPVRVSINLSRRQLRDSNAFEHIRERLAASSVPPDCLEFEISETVLKDETPAIRDALKKLGGFGVGLSVDNFGTGYTSLQHLRKVPVTALKIDKLFIGNLLAEDDDAVLTDAIIAMAHSLGISIVAEGVESDEQWQRLRERSCDFIQGYLVSKPLAESEFLALLTSHMASAG